jgi:hypothetical protein
MWNIIAFRMLFRSVSVCSSSVNNVRSCAHTRHAVITHATMPSMLWHQTCTMLIACIFKYHQTNASLIQHGQNTQPKLGLISVSSSNCFCHHLIAAPWAVNASTQISKQTTTQGCNTWLMQGYRKPAYNPPVREKSRLHLHYLSLFQYMS